MGTLYASAAAEIDRDPDLRPHWSAAIGKLTANLGAARAGDVLKGLVRHSFLVEPVKLPKVETTTVQVRWFEDTTPDLVGPRFDRADPRYGTFDECRSIFLELLAALPAWIEVSEHLEAIHICVTLGPIAYELPVDYAERAVIQNGVPRIHMPGNLGWRDDPEMLAALRVRRAVLDRTWNTEATLFSKMLQKVAVKCYLTDRALTGDHKTNREKRWEAHPASVHFALRRHCIGIEGLLLRQVLDFEGFPEATGAHLEKKGIIGPKDADFRCPITLEPISYAEFRSSIENPVHGKSDYQVGHLNPLKNEATPETGGIGHSPSNISWISGHGNRIQGSLTLAETQALLVKIAQNYEQEGLLKKEAQVPPASAAAEEEPAAADSSGPEVELAE